MEQYPNRHVYRAAHGVLLTQAGRADEARGELEQFSLADIPEDGDWLVTMTVLADLVADLGDGDRAGELYERLLPYEGANVVIGFAAACEGPAARPLGRLAAATGRPYERHFERALEMADRLQAPLLAAQIQRDLAHAAGDA